MDRLTTRRQLLGDAAGLAAVTGLGGSLLAGCGSSGSKSGTSSAGGSATSGAKPKRGGTFKVGITGGGTSETLNPLQAGALLPTSFAEDFQLFDSLATIDASGKTVLQLAEEMQPNHDATVWTIRLRSGLEFHNGKSVTADDVIYTLKTILSPKKPSAGATGISLVDYNQIRKVDKLTVRVGCKSPFSGFLPAVSTAAVYSIVPVGFDPKTPVGTGPFKYQSFTPGQQATLVRNPNYWMSGLPYADGVEFTDFNDETSQVNALLGGTINMAPSLSAASLARLKSTPGVGTTVSDGGLWAPLFMRTDLAPFSDPRVRRALRLLVDRQAMLGVVFSGHGTIGNDLFSYFDPVYDHSLPQIAHDPEQAKALLKQAGHGSGLNITMTVSDVAQGVVNMAQIYAQQASQVGVKVTVNNVPPDTLFGPNYLKWPFSTDFWPYFPYSFQVAVSMIPTANFNETHFDNRHYNQLFKKLQMTTDLAGQRAIVADMQKIEHQDTGYIIPFFSPTIDAYSSSVHGVIPSRTGFSFNQYDLKQMWLD
jgi:peptide/nickel transport system substrate-binding protein